MKQQDVGELSKFLVEYQHSRVRKSWNIERRTNLLAICAGLHVDVPSLLWWQKGELAGIRYSVPLHHFYCRMAGGDGLTAG